jgi:hypothetical protein
MPQAKALVLFLILLFTVGAANGQSDSVKLAIKKANKEANRAALYSAVLPGLGQIYNRSYWKLPIIYGGGAALGYFTVLNYNYFKDYRDAYELRIDNDPSTIDEFDGTYSDNQLKVLRDDYRRNYQLTFTFTVALYALNIIDAYVDRHLKTFDISDDLALGVRPLFITLNSYHLAPGVSLRLHFKG